MSSAYPHTLSIYSPVYLWDQLTVTTVWNTGETGDINSEHDGFGAAFRNKKA